MACHQVVSCCGPDATIVTRLIKINFLTDLNLASPDCERLFTERVNCVTFNGQTLEVLYGLPKSFP